MLDLKPKSIEETQSQREQELKRLSKMIQSGEIHPIALQLDIFSTLGQEILSILASIDESLRIIADGVEPDGETLEEEEADNGGNA